MTMTIDEIDAEIAMWADRLRYWAMRDFSSSGGDIALRGARACLGEIEKLRCQRWRDEPTERK